MSNLDFLEPSNQHLISQHLRCNLTELIFVPQTPPPFPAPTPRPTSSPFTPSTPRPNLSSLLAETPGIQAPPSVVRYTCGDGYQPDVSDTSIPPSSEVAFDYEIHNGIDVTVGDALRDVKGSILSDIAGRMGCYETYSGRKLQDSPDEFGNIIGLQSNANDLPDPDAGGCIVDVETDDPTTCTPVSGGFTVYAKPGTSESSLQETTNSLKGIIETGMGAGIYETETMDKAIYIGDRDKFAKASPAPINAQSDEADESNEGMQIAIYALACACLILICLLWFTCWTYREKEQKRKDDEEMAFDNFMTEKEENKHSTRNMMMTSQASYYLTESQRRPPPPPRQLKQNQSRRTSFESNGSGDFTHRPRSSSRGVLRRDVLLHLLLQFNWQMNQRRRYYLYHPGHHWILRWRT